MCKTDSIKMILFSTCLILCLIFVRSQDRCGVDFGGLTCSNPEEPCCSKHGYCGNTAEHCSNNCQSGCWYPPPSSSPTSNLSTPPSNNGSAPPTTPPATSKSILNSGHIYFIIVACLVVIFALICLCL